MREWKKYTRDRLILEHPEGFYVIKPECSRESHPLFCPLCNAIMRSNSDVSSYSKFKCCDSCSTFWAYPNKVKWEQGWRPSPEDVMNKYKDRDT